MRYVGQRESWDCGVATLAMVAGHAYEQVLDSFAGPLLDGFRKEDRGIEPYRMEAYLWHHGLFLRRLISRKSAPGAVWPPRPFAGRHFLMVKSPTMPNGHWVAMDAEGGVLDPFDHSRNGEPSSFYGVCFMAWGVAAPMEERA